MFKKWVKTKVKERLDNEVLISPKLYKAIANDIINMKLITVGTISRRFKISG